MGLNRQLRTVAKLPLNALLKAEPFRRRVVFELRQHYYKELEIRIPLAANLWCPITFLEAWTSFSEIFVKSEYGTALKAMPLPGRWLDLGCHAGFFSLYVIWQRAEMGLASDFKALLVDGDNRVKEAIDALIEVNGLAGKLKFQHGLISANSGAREFIERDHMASSLSYGTHRKGTIRLVETLPASRLMELLPPPYELVKVDLEGGEYEFLTAYQSILDVTKYLLIEWHSWHPGGGGVQQVRQLVCAQGFEPSCEVVSAHDVQVDGKTHQCGVTLFHRP
jgi:hypothetical protein